jgi:hypothetical protein
MPKPDHDPLRDRVASRAARHLAYGQHRQYQTAKRQAALQLGLDSLRHGQEHLPTTADVRYQLRCLRREQRRSPWLESVRQQRLVTLRVMQLLAAFQPRLIGPLASDRIDSPPPGGDVVVVHPEPAQILDALPWSGMEFRPLPTDNDRWPSLDPLWQGIPSSATLEQWLLEDAGCSVRLLILSPPEAATLPPEAISLDELIDLLADAYPEWELQRREPSSTSGQSAGDLGSDRGQDQGPAYRTFRQLLLGLEQASVPPQRFPTGDGLDHSLQVFEAAWQSAPYDEEFLLAALLHEVGWGLDPDQPTPAALEALSGWITPRTAWLIEHLESAEALRLGQLGHRAHRRLRENASYLDLLALAECDRRGHVRGARPPSLEVALERILAVGFDNDATL